MSDLVEFLRARLDEDEAVARAAIDDGYGAQDWAGMNGATDVHIARHDPARVLREVEAKRLLIHAAAHDAGAGNAEGAWAELVLSGLASIYADHPDYRQEWA